MCLAQGPQHSDAGEARTRNPSVSSQAVYHWANALPCSYVLYLIALFCYVIQLIKHDYKYINISWFARTWGLAEEYVKNWGLATSSLKHLPSDFTSPSGPGMKIHIRLTICSGLGLN